MVLWPLLDTHKIYRKKSEREEEYMAICVTCIILNNWANMFYVFWIVNSILQINGHFEVALDFLHIQIISVLPVFVSKEFYEIEVAIQRLIHTVIRNKGLTEFYFGFFDSIFYLHSQQSRSHILGPLCIPLFVRNYIFVKTFISKWSWVS